MPKLAVSLAVASAVTVFAVLAGASNDPNGSGAASSVQVEPKTCADLMSCCGKISEKGTHKACVESYTKHNGNDVDCNNIWQAFASYCDPANAPKAPDPEPKPTPKPKPKPHAAP